MKIIQINTVIGTGSVGKIAASLYEISEKNGVEAFAAYGRGHAPENMKAVKIGTPLDMYAHVCRNFFRGESGFGSVEKTRSFLRKLEQIKPDVIHLHNIHGFYLQIELLFQYIKEKKIPVVWTFHDCWPFTGHCAYFDYAKCDKWKTGCNKCEQHRTAYPYALFKDNSKNAYERKRSAFTGVENLTIVTPSKWLARLVHESFLREYTVQVIPNGVDQTVFRAETSEKNEQTEQTRKMLLGVANIWEARKGLSYFEELARMLPENYHITLVGLNRKQIASIQKDNMLKEKITAIARTENQTELAALYRKADIYVNTTLEDNFPTTNLEALSCGTPVITFATGGSPEAMEGDAQIGITVPKGDVQAMAQAIQKMANQKKPVEACIARAAAYDKEKCFYQYIELYRRVLHES